MPGSVRATAPVTPRDHRVQPWVTSLAYQRGMAAVFRVRRSSPPAQPPPRVAGGGPAPPPAWVETPRESRWLAFSSFCWSDRRESRCTDFVPASERTDVPRIRVAKGERVRFHLGFEAREVFLFVGGKRVLQRRRATTRTIAWRVSGKGLIGLLAYPRAGGDASYVARLR